MSNATRTRRGATTERAPEQKAARGRAGHVPSLQQAFGNQAVQRYIQRDGDGATATAPDPRIDLASTEEEEDEPQTLREKAKKKALGALDFSLPLGGQSEEDEEGGEGGEEDEGPSVGISAEKGLYAKGLQPFGGSGPSLDLSGDEQSLSFDVPGTEFGFPPPDGEYKLQLVDLKYPIVPGFGVSIGAGIEGGLKMPGIGLEASHKQAENDASITHTLNLAGKVEEAEASIGGFVQIGVFGGIPYVVTGELGARARADASVKLSAEIGGTAEWNYQKGDEEEDEPELVKQTSEIYFTISGIGELTAALQAYFSGQIFLWRGDFWTFDIAEAKLASIKAGAKIAKKWEDGAGQPIEAEPLEGNKYVSFNWLLGEIMEARKLDKAQAKLLAAQRDVTALEDVRSFYETATEGQVMRQRLNGEVRALLERLDTSTGQWETNKAALTALDEQIDANDTTFAMASMFADDDDRTTRRTGVFSRSSRLQDQQGSLDDQVKALRKQKKALEKQRTGIEGDIRDINLEITTAQQRFAASLTPANVGKTLQKARAALSKQLSENSKLHASKLAELESEIETKREALTNRLADNRRMLTAATRRGFATQTRNLQASMAALENDMAELDAEFERRKGELAKLVTLEEEESPDTPH